MNRYRRLCCLVKAFNNSFISDSAGSYLVTRSVFSIRYHSKSIESQTTDSSPIVVDNNTSPLATDNVSSELDFVKSEKSRSVIRPAELQDLSDYGSALKPSFNFAAYADKSPLLQKLIELGVRLYEWEKDPKAVEFILPLDFDKSIRPYIMFLTKYGVPLDKIGDFITRNPHIFKEDIDDLEVRINYLKSKKFDKDMIANIITRNPKWLSTPVKQIDSRLGYLQTTFHLKGDDVRRIVTKEPSLGTVHMKKLYLNVLILNEEMELEQHEVKKLVVAEPHLLRTNPHDYLSSYDYIRREMKVPKSLILKTPKVLSRRKHKLNERHKFLMSLGKAQYNPLLPGYISLSSFFTLTDEEFCEKIAKTSLNTFYEYLKTF